MKHITDTEAGNRASGYVIVFWGCVLVSILILAIFGGNALYKEREKEKIIKKPEYSEKTTRDTYWKNCITLPRKKGDRVDSITILAPPTGTKTAPCINPRLGGYEYAFESDNNEPFWRELNTRPGELVSYEKGDQRYFNHKVTPVFRFFSKTTRDVPITFVVKKR